MDTSEFTLGIMKKRIKSRFTAGAFAMTLLSQSVHAEIDPNALSNAVDVFTAVRAITNEVRSSTSKSTSDSLSPTAEQRAVIINEIARGAGDDSDAIQQLIVSAQSPIQSVLETASCVQGNRIVPVVVTPFPGNSNFMSEKPSTQMVVVNTCADAVRVDQWKMTTPDVLEFTAMFRPVQTEQVNTWRFKIKRQTSGAWELESRENISSNN